MAVIIAAELWDQAAHGGSAGKIIAEVQRERSLGADRHRPVEGQEDVGQVGAKFRLFVQLILIQNKQPLAGLALVTDKCGGGLVAGNGAGQGGF